MLSNVERAEIELITTLPQSCEAPASRFRRQVVDVARWSEKHGCSATLVYSDNRLADPWVVSQLFIGETDRLIPLVAVQPAYMHPYAVATLVASLAHIHGRKTYLNMVAGGFGNDLKALDDPTPHDHRYDRLVEYTRIVMELMSGEAVTFEGNYYRVYDLKLAPEVPEELRPEVFVSGSSEAGRRAGNVLEARPVAYPKPPGEQEPASVEESRKPGLRVGIIARDDRQEAWRIAHRRFPANPRGQMIHRLARKVSDSVWHRELSEIADRRAEADDPYWLVPFENYATMCPYLVGSYEEVGAELARYLDLGYRTFLLDIPREESDLVHIRTSFRAVFEGEVV